MKKIDFIIMNPPYDRSMHLKFLEKTIEIADTIVNISPHDWLTKKGYFNIYYIFYFNIIFYYFIL